MKTGIVYICHHIDTEGPLYEGLEELFSRVSFITGLTLPPTQENVVKLQHRRIDISDQLWEELKLVIDPHTINFLGSWNQIDVMLNSIMTPFYRNQLKDSFGGGWIFNWHIMDHVGFTGENPRRRDLGYFKIFDYYTDKIRNTGSKQDSIHWHFHPIAFKKDAHIPATCYENSMYELHQILSRRLVEKQWFPIVNRAGFHSVRFDSNLFLEQWIPFDPSSQAIKESRQPKFQQDLTNGRFGDWRGAPDNWEVYNPDYRDWRKKGKMNRYVARVLNMNSRHRNIDEVELSRAFERAMKGENVYLGITNHDWRDMKREIDDFRVILNHTISKFPEVKYKFSESKEAFQRILFPELEIKENAIRLESKIVQNRLIVDVVNGETFGPQPYLAIKTKCGKYYHDNFDFLNSGNSSFVYTLDDYTIPISNITAIAVASNDKYGNQSINILNDL